MITVSVATEGEGWAAAGDLEALAQRAAEAALAVLSEPLHGDATAELLFTDDATIRELNLSWRKEDKPTNVLSFPSPSLPARSGAPRHLGDIALAYETVALEARAEGKSLRDHAAHLVVHGLLHLLGHDHGSEREAVAMERIEVEALARLGVADPYASSLPREPAEAP